MAQNKKKKQNGDLDEFDDSVSLEDFVIPQKVDAFLRAFESCPVDDEESEQFDETRLRTFFKAYPCKLGDPLTIYLSKLEKAGFTMEVGVSGEPSIFVKTKVRATATSLIDRIDTASLPDIPESAGEPPEEDFELPM